MLLLLLLMCCDVILTSFADRPRDDALSHVTCPDTAAERRSIQPGCCRQRCLSASVVVFLSNSLSFCC